MRHVVVSLFAGGLVGWLWGEQFRRYSNTKSREVRVKMADTLQAVETQAGHALDRTKERTGDVLERAKEQVSSALHAGQEAIRPRS